MWSRKLLVNRSILLILTIVAFPWSFINEGIDKPLKFFLYFTIWSNIFCFGWAILAFTAAFTENEKLENFVNNWFVKGTPVVWISLTFLVLNFVLIPWYLSSESFGTVLKMIFGTSIFQHVLVPIFMVLDLWLTKGFNKKTKYTIKEISINSLISVVPGLAWLGLSLILLSLNLIDPQYPFMKFFGDVSNERIIIDSVVLFSIAILFIFLTVLLFWYHNKQIDVKNNQNKKILNNKKTI